MSKVKSKRKEMRPLENPKDSLQETIFIFAMSFNEGAPEMFDFSCDDNT